MRSSIGHIPQRTVHQRINSIVGGESTRRPIITTFAMLPSGVIRLSFGYDNHSSVDANLPNLLTVLATDDRRVPRANWQRLNNIMVTADGALQPDDPDAHERQRYYQVLQAP
jgi:hypothetical protein